MFRRLVCAAFVLIVCLSVALADEFRASITKVADGKVTFHKTKFDKDTKKVDKGAAETLAVADKVKVTKSKFNKDTKKLETEELSGGLKNEMFSKIDAEKGVGATIVTDADNKKITEIRIGGFGGGFPKKGGKDK